ncbi:L,D-transpeptidase family protein [Aquibium sp. A9E412]|uniref:L,D-transpeptidase family protein n=1 Tax=Aquibium sp. A9E412 TaxID=2976767 RepID=UPI0025AFD4CC|nr:L,D-transpeptidase family protein [Aquibium sp. A9E412]MDN2567675.1 L,D-transpeptidase family protein [Aquibium sp. A9E412]
MAVVAAAVLGVGLGEAAAQNIFDMLFGGNRLNNSRVEREPVRRAQPEPSTRRAPRVRISSPSFYDYTPEALVRVETEALLDALAAPQPAAFDAAGGRDGFRAAVAGLGPLDLYAEKPIAAALIERYGDNPSFIWVDGHHPNARAEAALRVLGEAQSHGLSAADYAVAVPPAVFRLSKAEERLHALVRFELALSARVLRYARDAHGGRVEPNKLSGYHDLSERPLDLAHVLDVMARTRDSGVYLESFHPQNAAYGALRVELETLRGSQEKAIVVAPDTFVRPGGSDPEFAKILTIIERDADAAFRAEHGATLARHLGSETYDSALVPVIKAAQRARGLNPDGIIGPRTVGALAGESKQARIDKVLLALERLRWHPSELGDPRVVINAAGFRADFIEGGRERLSMRTVVGTKANQTSFFHDEIEYVEFNPYWGVPRSILVNEMLPKLVRDPGYLDRAGYEVTDRSGRRVSSAAVNWGAYGAQIPFDVRQKPGKSNALGELKIMFPNKHAIYMHDTPARHLFERDTRAYSHGCVRLQDPRAMAAAVLDWQESRVSERVRAGHSRQDVPRKIPVYVGYFTAWPDSAGAVAYHGDVYGRDARLETALRKVADVRAPSS